jgi:SAM-dependent methyltransferase
VKVEACDLSPVRVAQAREIRKMQGKDDIRFFQTPLESIAAPDASYDRITCRHVFEFLPDPMKVVREFLRVLKPGGQALIVQFDGFLFNYFHKNAELSEMLEAIRAHGHPDLFRGRKIPSLFLDAGFTGVDWDVQAFPFKGRQLEMEREQMRQRLEFSAPGLAPILGSLERSLRFRDLYCAELDKPGSVLFYNKFFIWGTKGSAK